MLGLYIPDDGLVMVGGTNVNQIRPEDVRKNFGVVHQNVALFSGKFKIILHLVLMIMMISFWLKYQKHQVSWIG